MREEDYIEGISEKCFKALMYCLSIKGGFYGANGEIVNQFCDAKMFASEQEAIAFRQRYDKLHGIDEAMLLTVTALVEEI